MPYAIFTDYSGVTETRDGAFATRVEALERLIEHLEARERNTAINLRIARAALRRERRNC